MMSVRFSWDVGLKKLRPILLPGKSILDSISITVQACAKDLYKKCSLLFIAIFEVLQRGKKKDEKMYISVLYWPMPHGTSTFFLDHLYPTSELLL